MHINCMAICLMGTLLGAAVAYDAFNNHSRIVAVLNGLFSAACFAALILSFIL